MTELSYRETQKQTAAQELAELAQAQGDQVVGEYTGTHKKIDMRCSNGHLFSTRPTDSKNGVRRPKCSGRGHKQAKEQ